MIVYVKECQYVSLKDIVTWIKNGIAVQPFKSKADVRENDVVIMSNRDEDTDIRLTMNNVLIYEDFFEKVSSSIIQEFCYNHDYYYLKNALSRAKESDITTLISGSSYGVLGIDPSYIENTVNLSSISQDLYYSSSLVKGACATNLNIKNIVFCVGYYYFFTDLSRTQNQDEILRISKVYKPLPHDEHHCILLPPCNKMLYESNIFDIEKVFDLYTWGEYTKGFFNQNRQRKDFAAKEWDDKSKSWSELSSREKIEAGKRRAELHNRSIKREYSFLEHVTILQDFLDFCSKREINVLFVITPVTSYYLDYLDPDFKSEFYRVLNEVNGIVHLLDLSDNKEFVDADFNDTDHLNDRGAKKLTLNIVQALAEM